jgi:hypothetical protein
MDRSAHYMMSLELFVESRKRIVSVKFNLILGELTVTPSASAA